MGSCRYPCCHAPCFRSQLVNAALVQHFMTECQILRHFVALKRFLLLEDGEFGLSLSTKLFEEVIAVQLSPWQRITTFSLPQLTYGGPSNHLLSPSFLNPLLSSALDSSLHGNTPEAKQLSFALKYKPASVKTLSELVLC